VLIQQIPAERLPADCQGCAGSAEVYVSVGRSRRYFRFRLCERCLEGWRDALGEWLGATTVCRTDLSAGTSRFLGHG
jgi:hypothetical protein